MSAFPKLSAFASSWNFSCGANSSSSKLSHLPDPIGYKFVNDYRHLDSVATSTTGCAARGTEPPGGSTGGRTTRNHNIQNRLIFPSSNSDTSFANQLSAQNRDILAKRAWDVAISPAKSMGMSFLMMYLSGGASGIFGILIIGYALINCVRTLLSVCTAFKTFEETPGMSNILLQKVVYLCICVLGLGYVLYQCTSLGLLPLNSGDYIALIPEKQRIEKCFTSIT